MSIDNAPVTVLLQLGRANRLTPAHPRTCVLLCDVTVRAIFDVQQSRSRGPDLFHLPTYIYARRQPPAQREKPRPPKVPVSTAVSNPSTLEALVKFPRNSDVPLWVSDKPNEYNGGDNVTVRSRVTRKDTLPRCGCMILI